MSAWALADLNFPDRTSKGIGVLNAAPLYEALPGFERLVAPLLRLSFRVHAY